MKNYIYCLREEAAHENESIYFKIGHANDLERRLSSIQTGNSRLLQIVFVLGPFLDRDEAKDVEAQAHRVLGEHHVRGEWFDTDPRIVPGFWEWIDAQILPIRDYETNVEPHEVAQASESASTQQCRWQQGPDGLYRRTAPIQGSFCEFEDSDHN